VSRHNNTLIFLHRQLALPFPFPSSSSTQAREREKTIQYLSAFQIWVSIFNFHSHPWRFLQEEVALFTQSSFVFSF